MYGSSRLPDTIGVRIAIRQRYVRGPKKKTAAMLCSEHGAGNAEIWKMSFQGLDEWVFKNYPQMARFNEIDIISAI